VRKDRPPKPTAPNVDAIPSWLKEKPQWVVWRFTLRGDEWSKIPYQARDTKKGARSNEPSTWATVDEAWATYQRETTLDGIGYAFSAGDPYFGVDVDHCLNERGEVLDWAAAYLGMLRLAYGEISPTGSGVKFIACGKLPGGAGTRRNGLGPDGSGALELYDHGRYFALTGNVYGGQDGAGGPAELQDVAKVLYAVAKGRPGRQENGRQGPADGNNVERRAIAYLAKCEPAISGQRGHDKAFGVACRVGPGFDLMPADALRIIQRHYNPRCKPPWSEAELRHKIDDAYERELRRGWLLGDGRSGDRLMVNEAPDDPHRLARVFLAAYWRDGLRTLRFYQGQLIQWNGAYMAMKDAEALSGVTTAVKDEFDRRNKVAVALWEKAGGVDEDGNKITKPRALKVTKRLVGDVMQAIHGYTLLAGRTEPPCWLTQEELFPASELIPTKTAVVHLPSVILGDLAEADPATYTLKPTPRLFNTYTLDFEFDLDADEPSEWLNFLHSLWDDDEDAIARLQEWFGYCLLPDTSHQKMALLVGPKRSGRGTIARVLTALIGKENVAGPRLSAFANNFGLESLIGKPLAIVGDARISRRADRDAITEALLTITGEDTLTIDRKHRTAWTGRLPTRLMLLTNELPKLIDESGALASRFLIWQFVKSFLGREDLELGQRLTPELPGILNWAIIGYQRLQKRGHLQQPQSSTQVVEQLHDISSPMGAYARERIHVELGTEILCSELFRDWEAWCSIKRRSSGDEQTFGRNLRTIFPWLKKGQHRRTKETNESAKDWYYQDLTLKTEKDT
jgi:putative DNA primase/helicase